MRLRNGLPMRIRAAKVERPDEIPTGLRCVACGGPVPRKERRPYCFKHTVYGQKILAEVRGGADRQAS